MNEDEERHADEVNIAFQMGAKWERKQSKARIEKLEAALQRANANVEEYERKFYLGTDRIEKLEAALREVIECWDWWQVDTYDRCASVPSDAIREARKALEGKDE